MISKNTLSTHTMTKMSMNNKNQLTVIDFFCGAGGFSEGFKQQDFKIVMGIDNWRPAIDTFNYNFGLDCSVKNILDFENSVEAIEALPNTDIIIGSPPCVSFSSSNKSGKADKSMGVRLTEIFLRIVTVKKFQPNSILKAWLMENVTNSTNYLARHYNFKDLNLESWAKKHRISPNKIAITIEGNSIVINSAEYGSPQTRRRVITGELVLKSKLVIPPKLYRSPDDSDNLPLYRTLGFIKKSLPAPNSQPSKELVKDPLYPSLLIKQSEISDHFYDTGLYECEWKNSKFLKTNHPYMGSMSFPENESKPSRTITATKIGTSREAIIYKSEYRCTGNGEYRTPTVREAATLMGFPLTYQFIGSEGTKHRLVGNAVCPAVSRAFAACLRNELQLTNITKLKVRREINQDKIYNLNTYSRKVFDNPPKRTKGSRFRRHPFKEGNMTVTLSNYNIMDNGKNEGKWRTSVQYGNGEGFPIQNIEDGFYKELEPIITALKSGEKFLQIINNGFSERVGNSTQLQEMYEQQRSSSNLLEPTILIEEIPEIIKDINCPNELFFQDEVIIFKNKEKVPVSQIFALYAINKISSIANN